MYYNKHKSNAVSWYPFSLVAKTISGSFKLMLLTGEFKLIFLPNVLSFNNW